MQQAFVQQDLAEGTVGFLVDVTERNEKTYGRAVGHWELRERPLVHGEVYLRGAGVITHELQLRAYGLARVVKVCKNGSRLLRRITDQAEVQGYLEMLGWAIKDEWDGVRETLRWVG